MKPKWIPRYKATDCDGEHWYYEYKPTFTTSGNWRNVLGHCQYVGKGPAISAFKAFKSLKILSKD